MAASPDFDDPGPPSPEPPGRARRALTVAILLILIASMVFLAFVSGRGLISPPARPAPSVTEAAADVRLAVVDAAGRLTTTDARGGSIVRYGDDGIVFSFPAWAPDGSQIAVLGRRADGTSIYVIATNREGDPQTNPMIVYESLDQPPFYLSWGPDGRSVAFLTSQADGLALRVVDADGAEPAHIVRQGAPMYWAWADGQRLLVHSGGDGPDEFLGEVGPDGSVVERTSSEPSGFRAPVISADGRFRAFVAPGRGTAAQIVIEGRDGAAGQALDIFGVAALGFGPATDQLAFISAAASGQEAALPVGPLRLLDAVSGTARTLIDSSVVAFYWAPDGMSIAAFTLPGPGNNGTPIAFRPAATSVGPALAVSGVPLRIVLVDVGSGRVEVDRDVTVSDAFVAEVVPFFDQYAQSHRFWAGDSSAVVVPVAGVDGTALLAIIPADGSDAVMIPGVAGAWSP